MLLLKKKKVQKLQGQINELWNYQVDPEIERRIVDKKIDHKRINPVTMGQGRKKMRSGLNTNKKLYRSHQRQT